MAKTIKCKNYDMKVKEQKHESKLFVAHDAQGRKITFLITDPPHIKQKNKYTFGYGGERDIHYGIF